MSAGKCCSQAGHAYLGAFLAADIQRQAEYHIGGIGTKVCLRVRHLDDLKAVHAAAKIRGLPCVLIEDGGRNTCFGGVPVITAAGIGPIRKAEFPELRRLQLFT